MEEKWKAGFPGLGYSVAMGADKVDSNRAWKTEVKGAGSLIFAPGFGSGFFDGLFQLPAHCPWMATSMSRTA